MSELAPHDSIRLEWTAEAPDTVSRAELIDLHKLLMEEYRFQVKLNSDRTQNYLALNTAIITVATGLLRFGDAATRPLVAAVFIVGVFVAIIGRKALIQGHTYYRAVVYKKTLVENLLGRHHPIRGHNYDGATLAVETTLGMASGREILQDAANWLSRPIDPKTITGGLLRVFGLFIVVDILGVAFVIVSTIADRW